MDPLFHFNEVIKERSLLLHHLKVNNAQFLLKLIEPRYLMEVRNVQQDRCNDWPDMTPLLTRQFAPLLAAGSCSAMSTHLCKNASHVWKSGSEMTNYNAKAHLPFISWHSSIMNPTRRAKNIARFYVRANIHGQSWGEKVLSLCVAQSRESLRCPAPLHTVQSQAKNISKIHTWCLIGRKHEERS